MKDLEIDFVTSSIDDKYHLELVGDNVKIHKLPIGKNPDKLHYQSNKELLVYSWRAYWFARKLAKKEKYDLSLAFFGIPCGFIAMCLGLPYIVSLRGSDVPFYSKRFFIIDLIFFKYLSKIVWKKANAVVALSNDLIDIARKTSKKQEISVLYNGIDVEEFRPNEEILAKEKTFNILFVGRLIERKGLNFLLEAFSSLSVKYPNARLLVAGDGPLSQTYQQYAKDNNLEEKIEFLGVVKHEEIVKVYQRSHVFVLPSLNEALGNVTQEALASGLPMITTRTGAAEIVGKQGILIEKCSAREIEQGIEGFISDHKLREIASQESRQLAEKMSWKNVAVEYAKLFDNLLGAKKNIKKKNNKMKIFVKILIALGFIAWILKKISWQGVVSDFRQIDIWWAVAFAAIYTFGVVMSSYKWKIFLDFKKIKTNFYDVFMVYLTGTFINNFFPSIVGGDTYRAYRMGKSDGGKYLEATSTVLVDRITGFIGVMVLILVFSLFNINTVIQNPILLAINLIIIASLCVEVFLFVLRMLPIWGHVVRFVPKTVIDLLQDIRTYRKDYKILGKTIMLGAIYNFIGVGMATWMLFQDLHINIGFSEFIVAISIVSIVSAIPISIGNIGIKEWAYLTFFGMFGVSGEAVISIAIFGRVIQMFVSFFALPFYLQEKKENDISS